MRDAVATGLYSQAVYAAELELASLAKSSIKSPELLEAGRKRLGYRFAGLSFESGEDRATCGSGVASAYRTQPTSYVAGGSGSPGA